jgi:hypothetical protein
LPDALIDFDWWWQRREPVGKQQVNIATIISDLYDDRPETFSVWHSKYGDTLHNRYSLIVEMLDANIVQFTRESNSVVGLTFEAWVTERSRRILRAGKS